MDRIPNAKWLMWGTAFTFFMMCQVPSPPWMWAFTAIGLVVACAFLVFHNPKNQPNRFDIALVVPILAMMWPVIAFAMLIGRPWNEPAWKNRNKTDEQ